MKIRTIAGLLMSPVLAIATSTAAVAQEEYAPGVQTQQVLVAGAARADVGAEALPYFAGHAVVLSNGQALVLPGNEGIVQTPNSLAPSAQP